MHFLNTAPITILALTSLAIANPTAETTAALVVKLALHALPTCADHPSWGLSLEANKCTSLGGAGGMQIVEKNGGLKYNACKYTDRPMEEKKEAV
jgi:hypothetical protein